MKILIILIFFIISCNFVLSQEFKIESSLSEILNSIPSGFSLLDSASGDLNKDKYPDYILILKKNNESEISNCLDNPSLRPLYIFLGNESNKFTLVASNEKAVLCFDCGGIFGDPYDGITIKNGFFTIEHYGGSAWRWTKYITFKYNTKDSNWYLHKVISHNYHNSNPNKISSKVLTTKNFGKILFEDFDIYKDR
jgi:hypothetical protein